MAETSLSVDRRRRSGVILPWAAFAVMFLLLAMTANRGLEMSDEAFYIFEITDPGIFKAKIQPYGVVFPSRMAGPWAFDRLAAAVWAVPHRGLICDPRVLSRSLLFAPCAAAPCRSIRSRWRRSLGSSFTPTSPS